MTVIIDPVSLIEPETQGAKRRRAAPAPAPIVHKDKILQDVLPGAIVVFAYAYGNGVKLGTVIKNTRLRTRIAYKHNWVDKNNEVHTYEWNYLARPERIIVLTDSLQQELTLLKLKGQLP